MKKKILAIALCLATVSGAAALTSCTANTGNTANDGTGTTAATTATTTEKATEKETETRIGIVGEAETLVDDITNGMRNRMGDPNFADHPHRGMTPYGK